MSPEDLVRHLVWTRSTLRSIDSGVAHVAALDAAATRDRVRAANPVIYQAVSDTMRFGALFRYLRTSMPATWRSLLSQISQLAPLPRVQTPTAVTLPTSGSSEND